MIETLLDIFFSPPLSKVAFGWKPRHWRRWKQIELPPDYIFHLCSDVSLYFLRLPLTFDWFLNCPPPLTRTTLLISIEQNANIRSVSRSSIALYYISLLIGFGKYSIEWRPPICVCRLEMELLRPQYTKFDPFFLQNVKCPYVTSPQKNLGDFYSLLGGSFDSLVEYFILKYIRECSCFNVNLWRLCFHGMKNMYVSDPLIHISVLL